MVLAGYEKNADAAEYLWDVKHMASAMIPFKKLD